MKRLDRNLDIGPKDAAEFAQAGIRTLGDLAKADNLDDLSQRTAIPEESVRQWREEAAQKIQASRHRRRVAIGIVVAVLAVLGWLGSRYLRESPAAMSERAALLYNKGDYASALRLYNHVIRIDPKFELAWANRGGALRRLGREDEALTSLNRALELAPDDVWTHRERGQLYADRGEYEQAIKDYDIAIEHDRTNQLAYSSKGYALYQLTRYNDALQAFDEALKLDPNDVWSYETRGNVYADTGKYQVALQDFEHAIALDPKYSYAYGSKGYTLHRLGRYKDALSALNKSIELQPGYTWAYVERGSLYQDNLYQYEAAYQDLKKACELASGDLDYKSDLAEATLTSGRFQEAFDLATKILSDNEKADVKKFEISERMSMRFIAIAALLLQNRSQEARAQLQEFVSYYKSVPPNFERSWSYAGTRHFIESATMSAPSKKLVLSLIQLLQQSPKSTIGHIEGMIPTLT